VELHFSIQGKDIFIKRVLKRGKDDIKQETGYLIQDGIKNEATHIELKSMVLDLLGYPKDLITRSTDLMYRFTVYTPQESMKQIVQEDPEVRLDTLRKVFNIDKYKRIRENAQIFIRNLKEKRKNYEGQIVDLDSKKKALQAKEQEEKELAARLKELSPIADSLEEKLKETKQALEAKELQVRELLNFKKEFELAEMQLRNKVEQNEKDKQEIAQLDVECARIASETKDTPPIEEILKELKDKESNLEVIQRNIIDLSKKLAAFETTVKHNIETKQKISQLDVCPLCKQAVSISHKEAISRELDTAALQEHIDTHKEQEKENRQAVAKVQSQLEELRKKQADIRAMQIRKDSLREKMKKQDLLHMSQNRLKLEIGAINVKKMDLTRKIAPLRDIEATYKMIRQEHDALADKEMKIQLTKKEIEVRKQETVKFIASLESELREKQIIKDMLSKIASYQDWLEDHFTKLMATMEKHVMLQVYLEFNALFQQWFSMLIEDETLNVRLDDQFTPIIEQNGYESSIDSLSGGERTSIALAYRLALNKVINDIISGINTKELLILDEPTDGFSSQQLDKVRDVLDQLKIQQIILVSHETKIESFVDHVIRISKREHVSEANI